MGEEHAQGVQSARGKKAKNHHVQQHFFCTVIGIAIAVLYKIGRIFYNKTAGQWAQGQGLESKQCSTGFEVPGFVFSLGNNILTEKKKRITNAEWPTWSL